MGKFIKEMLKSYFYAFRGVFWTLRERNMRVHVVAAIVVIAMGVFFKISTQEWITLTIVISLMFSAETFNTAIESICNENRDLLGVPYEATTKARDVSAGAVLLVAIGSVIVGGIIFVPKIVAYFTT